MTTRPTIPTTLFVGGLWLNPEQDGFLTRRFPNTDRMVRLSLVGEPTIESRADKLVTTLHQHPSINQIVAHSAGTLAVHAALERIKGQVKTAVLLNPAPLPGIMFGVFDPMFRVTLANWRGLYFGKTLKPSLAQMRVLLGQPNLDVSVYDQFVPDSSKFMRSLVNGQYGRKRVVNVPKGMRIITYIGGELDHMLGSTQYKTISLWHGYRSHRDLLIARWDKKGADRERLEMDAQEGGRICHSHVLPVQRFDHTLEFLAERTGFEI